MKVAWHGEAMGVETIVSAETRGKAIAIIVKAAREAGYGLHWAGVRAVRYPRLDKWAEVDESKRCWSWYDLRKLEGK